MAGPEITYADSDGAKIAYATLGEGPRDLVIVSGYVTNLDLMLDPAVAGLPLHRAMLDQLASFARVTVFDKRGSGLSDREDDDTVAPLELLAQDARAVMRAAGIEHASFLGISEGGPTSLFLAATYPELVDALVLYASTPRFIQADDWPWGLPLDFWNAFWHDVAQQWGSGITTDFLGGAAGAPFRDAVARFERVSVSPNALIAITRRQAQMDVRALLPSVQARTLVIHRTEDVIPVEAARYTADAIPGARLELFPGPHAPGIDWHGYFAVIEEFLTGEPRAAHVERVLTTVLFTDIVGSTALATELGDARWRDVLARHDTITRRAITRFAGVEVKHTGDGFLATFDGPARAIRCALAIADEVRSVPVEIRAGVHTGEVERHADDLAGITVHTGARVAALAGPSEVLATRTVKDLVAGSGLEFEPRGEHALKGVDGSWQLYAASDTLG